LKNALQDLTEAFGGVTLRYTATALLDGAAVDALYRAIASAVTAASVARGVDRVAISVKGSRSVTARIICDSHFRGAGTQLAAAALLARHSGITFEITTEPEKKRRNKTNQGTIVVIQYAGRSPAGG
jgi:hypothetical protein